MLKIDKQFLDASFYGVRQMTWHLRNERHPVNEKRIRRLMRLMGLMPIYQTPNTCCPATHAWMCEREQAREKAQNLPARLGGRIAGLSRHWAMDDFLQPPPIAFVPWRHPARRGLQPHLRTNPTRSAGAKSSLTNPEYCPRDGADLIVSIISSSFLMPRKLQFCSPPLSGRLLISGHSPLEPAGQNRHANLDATPIKFLD